MAKRLHIVEENFLNTIKSERLIIPFEKVVVRGFTEARTLFVCFIC